MKVARHLILGRLRARISDIGAAACCSPWHFCGYNADCMERIALTKICISGFAALAVVISTERWDAVLPFAAVALGFALYGMSSGCWATRNDP